MTADAIAFNVCRLEQYSCVAATMPPMIR